MRYTQNDVLNLFKFILRLEPILLTIILHVFPIPVFYSIENFQNYIDGAHSIFKFLF